MDQLVTAPKAVRFQQVCEELWTEDCGCWSVAGCVCVCARTSLYRIHIQYVSMCRGPGVIVCVSNGVCRCFALCMCVCIGLNVCFVGEPQSPQRPIEWNGLSHTYQPEATGYLPLINLMWLPYASPVTWQGLFLIIFLLFDIGVKT